MLCGGIVLCGGVVLCGVAARAPTYGRRGDGASTKIAIHLPTPSLRSMNDTGSQRIAACPLS